MNAAWIMFLSKREKVASQDIRGDIPDELQGVCVAIVNESMQEPPIEPECVSGQLACLPINQERLGCYTDIIPLGKFKNRLLMDFIGKLSGFSFLNSPFAEGKTTILAEPPMGFEPMT